MNFNNNVNFLLNMSEDEYYEEKDLHRNKIQKKEIKKHWQEKEDGINVHSVKSVAKARKW